MTRVEAEGYAKRFHEFLVKNVEAVKGNQQVQMPSYVVADHPAERHGHNQWYVKYPDGPTPQGPEAPRELSIDLMFGTSVGTSPTGDVKDAGNEAQINAEAEWMLHTMFANRPQLKIRWLEHTGAAQPFKPRSEYMKERGYRVDKERTVEDDE